MGRFALFNTGVEYKFVFGEQSSGDMIQFGGSSYYGRDEDEAMHSWNKEKDIVDVEKKLDAYGKIDGIEELKTLIPKYENNRDGTYKLKNDLFGKTNNYTYILGCIIYHQLQYVDILQVNFEL
jgi:hypothetical protein